MVRRNYATRDMLHDKGGSGRVCSGGGSRRPGSKKVNECLTHCL